MPKYRVTSPDGQTYEINAPDGASEAEVMAYAQQQFAQPAQQQPKAAAPTAPEYDPTEGQGFLENALIGFGKAGVDTWRGLKQITGNATAAEIDEARRLDAPLMNTWGGLAGNIAGQAAQMAVPVPGVAGAKVASMLGRAAPYAAAATRGGLFASTQGVGEDETRLGNATQGATLGAFGQGVASGFSRLGKGLSDKLSPEVIALYQKAQAAGIPVHFSQLSDSKFIKALSSTLAYMPFTGSGAKAAAQQKAFNRAAGRSFGQNADQLSDDVLANAKKAIGSEFDRIYGKYNVIIDTGAASKLMRIRENALRNLPPQESTVVANQIEDIIKAAPNGDMPGLAYQAFRTDRLLPGEGGKSFLAQAFRSIRKTMDEAAAKSVGPDDAKALLKARGQYRNLKTVEKSLKQVSGSTGDVRPASLWPIVNGPKGSSPELRELARIGQMLKNPIPDSGTPGRLLAVGAGGGGVATGGAAALGPWAAMLGLGAGAGRLANSEAAARYLAQGSAPLNGLARWAKAAPYLLPATASANDKKKAR